MKKHVSLSFRQLLTACVVLILFCCLTLFSFYERGEEKRFKRITSDLFHDEMTASTLNMHYTLANPADFGISDYEPVLPCYSADSEEKGQTATENILSLLAAIDPAKLSDSDAYTYHLLCRSLDNALALGSYAYYSEPLSPHSGMQSQLPTLLAEYTFRSERDVQDYLELLDQTDEYFASLLLYEQEKASAHLLMPASSLRQVEEQCYQIMTEESLIQEKHFLQTTFRERLNVLQEQGVLTAEKCEQYVALNNRLLRTVMLPAYRQLADGLLLLEDDEITLSGLASKPQGRDYYRYLLRSETGSYREIEDIRALLTEAFRAECSAIREIWDANPDIAEHLAGEGDISLPFPDENAILADLQEHMQDDFPSLAFPSATVKAVSESLEAYSAPAFYLTAPLDDTDTNVIYVNHKQPLTDLELYTTLAHEGYPGHMYQTVYCNRLFLQSEADPIRQLLWYGGYMEGWAVYVEFLSYDYASDVLIGQGKTQEAVSAQIEKHNRSLQLCLYSMLDIMIHYDNASPEQIAGILEPFGITSEASVNAVYSYIAEEPCNYLKYYLGYLEILELQKEARQLWKEAYSDLRFHTFFLNCGPSDFTTLEEELHRTADTTAPPALSWHPDTPDPTAGFLVFRLPLPLAG